MKISPRINGLSDISTNYELILCDVWGVLHNGVVARPGAMEALEQFRSSGGTVIMITNAPRPRGPVLEQLKRLKVPDGVFDEVVTSGDVTRTLMKNAPKKQFLIGPYEKDKQLFEGLDIELVPVEDAEAIICTGPFEDNQTADEYIPMLTDLQKRNLPFLCANPDKVVEVGNDLILCAGGIADEYEKLGGETRIAGKPFAPIYDTAVAEAEVKTAKKFKKANILAIGDGMPTDIKGAKDYGLDVLYVSGGIHAAEYGPVEDPIGAQVQDFLKLNDASPVAYLPRLVW